MIEIREGGWTLENVDVFIQKTGIDELDEVLMGGVPRGHTILLAGPPGSGKTVLAIQWLFNGYKKFNEPGIYATLTESVTKAIKNVKNMSFYDESLISPLQVHFTDLRTAVDSITGLLDEFEGRSSDTDKRKIDETINFLVNLIRESGAKRLVIDSVTAVGHVLGGDNNLMRYFIFNLGKILANLECTTILTSEVTGPGYSVFGVEEFICDGIIKMQQEYVKDKLRRNLQVVKMRGVEYNPEVHSFKIDKNGINLFPKIKTSLSYISSEKKISTGVAQSDEMCNGGVFEGSSTLVAGPTGSGKTVLSLQFILNGLENNENCLYVSFEESKDQLLRCAKGFGWNLKEYEKQGLLTFLCEDPENKHLEEHLFAIKNIVENKGVKRCVIDSLTGVAGSNPEGDFRDFAKKLTNYLKLKNVTSFMTAATSTFMGSEVLTDARLSTLTDNIILLKYIETSGELSRMIAVLKTRGSGREKALRGYDITTEGIIVGEPISNYENLMAGSSKKISKSKREKIRNGFVRTLGSKDGLHSFEEVIKEGISQESIDKNIDSLVTNGRISLENGEELKELVFRILKNIDTKEQRLDEEDVKKNF